MNSIVLRLGDLRDAASKYGRLSVPPGARGSIPRTTEIKPAPDGVSVETPHMEMGVSGVGTWTTVVSVDCKRLHGTLDDLKKRWNDIGGDSAQITLSSTATTLDFSWRDGSSSRRVSIPAWPPRPR